MFLKGHFLDQTETLIISYDKQKLARYMHMPYRSHYKLD